MRAAVAAICWATSEALASAQPLPEATKSYGPADAETRVLVRGTTDIELFEPVLQEFTARAGEVRIDYEQWGSNDLTSVRDRLPIGRPTGGFGRQFVDRPAGQAGQ